MSASAERITDETIATVAGLIERRELSPVDVTRAALENIEGENGALHAFISVDGDRALLAAREAERVIAGGGYRGALHGIPLGVKDNIAMEGLPTTAGSRILADNMAPEDAPVVRALKRAGAIVVGKTNLHEFAWGGTSDNPHYGTVRNPWDTSRFPGGSSGGSAAAVAARLCFGALGTDTDGSVRVPAAFNGVVGLRPSIGVVSNDGVVPLAWTMDTVGPLCRTARDCALLLAAMIDGAPGGADPAARAARWREDATGIRIGIDDAYCFDDLQPEVETALRAAVSTFQELGARIVPVDLGDITGNVAAEMTVVSSEASTYHQRWLRERAADYGDDVRIQLELGELLLATQYVQAQRYRTLLQRSLRRSLEQADVILSPTVGFVAIPAGATHVALGSARAVHAMSAVMRYTGLASLTGFPAISVPCGFSEDGLPIGLQLLGRPLAEHALLELGNAYQMRTDWHLRAPRPR